MSHDIFISHSSIDKTIADSVCAGLENAGLRCWVAPRDIRAGDSWGGSIIDAITASKVMVIIFSSNSNSSKQVMREVERAVQKDVVVVPFRIDQVQPSKDMEYFLSSTHWLDAITPDTEKHIGSLVDTIKSIVSDEQPPSTANAHASKKFGTASAASPAKKKFPILGVGFGAALCLVALLWLVMSGGDTDQKPHSATKNAAELDAAVQTSAAQTSEIEIKAPSSVIAGSSLSIAWSGTAAKADYIVIGKSDAIDLSWLQRGDTRGTSPLEIAAPDAPGSYEIRYFNAATRTVIARATLTIQAPEVKLAAADQATAGSEISVEWVAPNNKNDKLTIANIDSPKIRAITFAYITSGSPTNMQVPEVPGDYELRYISGQKQTIWAQRAIKVIAASASISAVSEAVAGSSIEIDWTGPANKNDKITVADIGSKGNSNQTFTYINVNKNLEIKLPEQPGDYEIRYVSGAKSIVWATKAIRVIAASATVSATTNAIAGGFIDIDWTGPANKNDLIVIAKHDSAGRRYATFVYIKQKSPITLRVPEISGHYEIRYVSAQKSFIWAKQALEVSQPKVNLSLVPAAPAGSEITISWNHPANKSDYITIGKVDSDVKKFIRQKYVSRSTSTKIQLPDEAGEYEVRYVSALKRLIWARALVIAE